MCCWVDVRDPNTVFYYTSVNGSHFHISAWWKATAMFLPEKLTVLAQRHSDSESWSHAPLVSPRGISFQSGEKYIFFYLIWVVPRITHRTKKSQRSRNLLWIKRNIIGFYSKPHSSPRRTNMAANSAQKKTTITINLLILQQRSCQRRVCHFCELLTQRSRFLWAFLRAFGEMMSLTQLLVA